MPRVTETTPKRSAARALALLSVLAFAACEQVDRVQERFRASTPHEAYERALDAAGLASTALARDWSAAARAALDEPTTIGVPYRETGYLRPERPAALGYRIDVERGQRVVAELRLETEAAGWPLGRVDGPAEGAAATGADAVDGGSSADGADAGATTVRPADAGASVVFMDLYRMGGDAAEVPYHEASADSGALRLEHEPWRGGTFVLRIQPELLRGGRYTLTVFSDASLAFPVQGRSTRSIRSVFGDPRAGGRREHHGVDIFAPRGTPALAATAGTVGGVRTTQLGGKVVWLRDRGRLQSLYYAHLDSQLVSNGMAVERGDTLGLVGNSGNARTTPTHLHFGIYRRGQGPVDPLPFLFRTDTVPEPIRADRTLVGGWARAATDGARLRAAPALRAPVVAELPDRTALRIIAATGDWYRVRLPDGRTGHLYARLTEAVDGAIAEDVARATSPVRVRPLAGAPVVDSILRGEPVPVLGRFGEFLLVRVPDGLTGWLAAAGGGAADDATASAADGGTTVADADGRPAAGS